MSAVILDASAVLAEVLVNSQTSVFNVAEVASHFFGLGMTDKDIEAILKPLPIVRVPADMDLAWDAARLRSLTSVVGLSLGDRFCLALARRENLPVWTADRIWQKIADAVGVKVNVIR